jgi:hypothetical protein
MGIDIAQVDSIDISYENWTIESGIASLREAAKAS